MSNQVTCEACKRAVHPRTLRRHKSRGCPQDDRGRRDVTSQACSVETCAIPVHAKGFCRMHYRKSIKHGDPLFEYQRHRRNLAGHRFGLLVAIEPVDRANWLCRCDCGTRAPVRTSSLVSGSTTRCGHRRHKRRTDTYSSVHQRLSRLKGRAAEHPCADCGGGAKHWSYDHSDPNELVTDTGWTYSLAPNHYHPRCVPCHKRFDLSRGVAA